MAGTSSYDAIAIGPTGAAASISSNDAATATAYFGPAISAPRTVTLNAPKTVGAMVFNNANSYTIAGSNTITIGDG